MSSHKNFKRGFDICILQSRQIESQLLPSGVGVEKVGAISVVLMIEQGSRVSLYRSSYEAAGSGDVVGRFRNRTSRLMFWAVAARKNCSRTNFNLRSRSRLRLM
jgi:hypothetical protein